MLLNIKDPSDPDIVFFGLIFVNLGPLKVLPIIKPPISDPIQVSKMRNNKILSWEIFEKYKKNKQNIKI